MSLTEPDESEDGSREPSEVERAENVKHLELIQAIVTRLASNSFFIKGWALTVAAASFGFAVNRIDWRVAVIGAVVVLGFWIMDAYYLRQERLFRHLYNNVRRNISTDLNDRFSMNLVPFAKFRTASRARVFFSLTLLVYYPLLVVSGVTLAILFTVNPSAPASIPPPAPAAPPSQPAVVPQQSPTHGR